MTANELCRGRCSAVGFEDDLRGRGDLAEHLELVPQQASDEFSATMLARDLRSASL